MAYSQTLNYVVGDTLPAIELTLKDKNTAASGQTLDPDNSDTWAPIDITGATVRMRLREVGGTTIVDTRLFSIVNGSEGRATSNLATTTFAASGTYEGEIEITHANNSIQTVFDLVRFKVRDDFD